MPAAEASLQRNPIWLDRTSVAPSLVGGNANLPLYCASTAILLTALPRGNECILGNFYS